MELGYNSVGKLIRQRLNELDKIFNKICQAESRLRKEGFNLIRLFAVIPFIVPDRQYPATLKWLTQKSDINLPLNANLFEFKRIHGNQLISISSCLFIPQGVCVPLFA